MRTRVTAILVAHRGGEWLDQTVAGLRAQTLAPDAIIAVNNGGSEKVGTQLLESGATRVVGLTGRMPFGQAVARGVQAAEEPGDASAEWIWLLSEDSCPEPEALAHIVSSVQRAPSVVVAGPKLVDWDRPERIIELGQSLTRYGSRWLLRRQELDQQQYDHMQDVLGVGPVGMLVRRDVWEQLGGFDPALPVYDDGLDFCVRARLAGHRVEVSPASRVRFAQSGVAGPRIDRARSVMRTAHRQARTSQIHRRISYAPAVVAFFEWLGLPVYGVLRVLWALIREQPGYLIGEFVAAMTVFFRPHLIVASRRRIRKQSTAGWGSIRQLRVDPKSVRTARMIDREAILASEGRSRNELHFISTGGLAVLVFAVVAGIALTWWALPHTSLAGGGLAPLSPIDRLWWNTRPLDGVPADPFAWVLALLGTLTFWNPSHAIVLLMVAAVPLTALGGWIWAAQLTESKAGRALVGVGFALSPVLLGSLETGRLPTLVLTVVLPWLLIAATRCRESWSWAGTASLLAAVALASAPILLPAAAVLLVVGLFTTLRGLARVLTTAIVPVALFAPKIVTSLVNGRPFDVLLDPGMTGPSAPGTTWHLLLGFPEFGLQGWGAIFDGIGLGSAPATLLVGVLLLPIALLALLGLFTGRVPVTLLNSLLGGLGMLTAVMAGHLHLTTMGGETIPLWTGSGLAVYWVAVLSLAAVGAGTLRRGAAPVVAVALVASIVAILPVGAQLLLDRVPFAPGGSQMPAIVQAAGESDPAIRTLVVTPLAAHSVRVQLVPGTGQRLDEIRTGASSPDETAADRELAELVGDLASVGGPDTSAALKEAGIGFVLLPDAGDDVERSELQRVFDQHSSLAASGQTDQGLLWRVVDSESDESEEGDATERLGGTSLTGTTIWTVQLALLLGVLLLALPTGEVTYRPERRKRPSKRSRASRRTGAAAGSGSSAVATASAETEPAADEPAENEAAEAEPAASEPAPAESGPAEPEAAEPGPAEPEATEPEATEPEPADPEQSEVAAEPNSIGADPEAESEPRTTAERDGEER